MSFVRVCSTTDIPVPGALQVEVDDIPVAVVRSNGDYYAIGDTCSHANVSLSEGEIEGTTIECWLHGSRFDLRSGRPTGLPATQPVPVYPIKVDGEDIYVDVASPLDAATASSSAKES